ncbi:MAG: hypothetical protein DMG14_02670 [Acidobacteria bacterium]|nr:MAG: hypothetical protein DMG14_02670 [Acidobacteriota bacterium]
MQYRVFLPHHRLILDVLVAAVLLTILGLTSSFFIQAPVDSVFVRGRNPALNCLGPGMLLVTLARAGVFGLRSHLLPHLSPRIDAETVPGYHRYLLGLPLTFFSSRGTGRKFTLRSALLYGAALILVGISAYVTMIGVSVPAPGRIRIEAEAVPIVIEAGGLIQKVLVSEGSAVHVGDPVIQLDTRHLLLKKLALESRIHRAELQPADIGDLASLYRELERTQLDLGRLTVTSPVDGEIISLASLYPGKMLLAGTAIALVFPRKGAPH